MRSLLIVAAAFGTLGLASTAWADSYVQGYTRSDGTYVAPHYRSSPNGNASDNYSTQGNTNPYTGKQGTVDPYGLSGSGGSKTWGSRKNTFGGNGGWE